MKKLISVFLAASMLASLASCGNENAEQNTESVSEQTEQISEETVPETEPPTEPPTDPPTEPPTDPPTEAPTTAIEALDMIERNMFNALVDFSSSLKNPSSIRLAEVKTLLSYIRITGENSFGGTASSWFCYDTEMCTISEPDLPENVIESLSNADIDVNKINKALQEYFG